MKARFWPLILLYNKYINIWNSSSENYMFSESETLLQN